MLPGEVSAGFCVAVSRVWSAGGQCKLIVRLRLCCLSESREQQVSIVWWGVPCPVWAGHTWLRFLFVGLVLFQSALSKPRKLAHVDILGGWASGTHQFLGLDQHVFVFYLFARSRGRVLSRCPHASRQAPYDVWDDFFGLMFCFHPAVDIEHVLFILC